jgi:hypothetical protein
MDARVGRLRTAAEALRTQLAALSQQQSQAAQAEAARPHTRGAKEAAVRREQEAAQLLSRQQEMTDMTVQLQTEAARLDAKAEAVEAYTALHEPLSGAVSCRRACCVRCSATWRGDARQCGWCVLAGTARMTSCCLGCSFGCRDTHMDGWGASLRM